jgi:hypothetical protein
MVLFLHGERDMQGLTANIAPRPATQPFCSYLGFSLLCTREKDIQEKPRFELESGREI